MKNKLIVAPSPHISKQLSTNLMMLAVLVGLVPTAISGVVNFGWKVLLTLAIAVVTAYLAEMLFIYLKDRRWEYADLSSLVTGTMVAMILPASAPWYYPLIGSVLAVVLFKGFFGGLGKNLFNPAAAARVVLGLVFAGLSLDLFNGIGPLSCASPLAYFMNGDYSAVTLRSLFLGSAPGAIGTTSIVCVGVAGILLMAFSVVDFIVPLCSLVTFIATVWIGRGAISIVPFLFTGSFVFVAMFMAPDPATSPYTVWGRLVYGLLFGLFAGLMRVFFVLGETGVFVALLAVNLLTPLLDKIFAPRPIGLKRRG